MFRLLLGKFGQVPILVIFIFLASSSMRAETGDATDTPELRLSCELSVTFARQDRLIFWRQLLDAQNLVMSPQNFAAIKVKLEPVVQEVEVRLHAQAFYRQQKDSNKQFITTMQFAALWLLQILRNNPSYGPGQYDLESLYILEIAGFSVKDLVLLASPDVLNL